MTLLAPHRLMIQVATAAAVLLTMVLVLTSWINHWNAASQSISASLKTIVHTQWIAEHRADIERDINLDNGKMQSSTAILAVNSAERASASLQRRLKIAIEGVGGTILSAQPIAATLTVKANVTAARFQITLSEPMLFHLLYLLEKQTPYIFVDRIEVTQGNNTTNSTANLATLNVLLEAHAFWQEPVHD